MLELVPERSMETPSRRRPHPSTDVAGQETFFQLHPYALPRVTRCAAHSPCPLPPSRERRRGKRSAPSIIALNLLSAEQSLHRKIGGLHHLGPFRCVVGNEL